MAAEVPLATVHVLEMMPSRMNVSKRDKIGLRQRDFGKQLYREDQLSRKGLEAVLR